MEHLAAAKRALLSVPGSAAVVRYVRASHQDDPFRTLLEIILIIFAIRTLLMNRTRSDQSGKNFVKLTEKEIDELVDEWTPEPLCTPLSPQDQADLACVPILAGPTGPKPKLASNGKTVLNFASYNFAGLAGNDFIKERAIETLRKYGLGSCGPPGFYGTIDVHLQLERDIAFFLGTESAILYSQAFHTVSSVIPAFCKRGDIIIADRGVNFAIQKGLQISRSTIRWYDHNNLKSLQDVLESVDRECKKKGVRLTRRFIVTEGIFEGSGQMVDLPKLIELKKKYKYRLVLDESVSFGSMGRTGRGLTELYNVPATEVDMLVGSIANGLCSAGGFCAGSRVVVDHQRINGTSFVFSAALPALLAVAASEAISVLTSTPSALAALHENARLMRSTLERCAEHIDITSHPASPIIHLTLKSSQPSLLPSTAESLAAVKSNPQSQALPNPPVFDIASEEATLQQIVDECLAQGVLVSRARRLRGQEGVEPRPCMRVVCSAALGRKDVERAAGIVKGAIGKVCARRR
ncbi:Serine C-palmitoyltransferase [Ceratobasidium theobromae]|uniref:serine C-palmitoyltransferase n=1 Tax=Ceratobasidium theobromae TaxID=1582974 RepID=A0A5N5Q8U1_9AGAM|nr:Serine C-palmitoyltransferase [Ceratobasidium theobromae]